MEWILLSYVLSLVALGQGVTNTETQLQVITPTSVVVRGYNEPCTCDSDCDFSKWLACDSGHCMCLSKTFLYDFFDNTCVVRLGQKCFEVAQDYSQYKELPPFIRCVKGAFCSISIGGLCACNTYGYYESNDGLSCEPKKSYGDRCQKPVECESEACSLTTGLCVCREGHYYDRSRVRCVGEVGSYCFTDEDCTENAQCNSHTAKCSCLPKFSRTPSKLCARQLNYGSPCNSSYPCNNPQLRCYGGTCLCANPNHQKYDNGTGNCQSLVASAPCQGHNSCVPHANCVRVKNDLGKVCKCVSGYVEMSDGTCAQFLSHGAPCTLNEECDPVPKLVCKDFLCQCEDGMMTYDPENRLCRGMIGFRNCQNNHNLCVQNARCMQSNPALPSKCVTLSLLSS